jgi:phospholipid/cholesterol/gamma-HCH transport system permease protein
MSQYSISNPILLPPEFIRTWIETNALERLSPQSDITLDFAQVIRMDSSAVALMCILDRMRRGHGKKLILTNIKPELSGVLRRWTADAPPVAESAKSTSDVGFFARIGSAGVAAYDESMIALSVLAEMLYWGTLGLLRKKNIRAGSLGEQMYQLGFKAIGIVALLSLLIGVVLALQTAIQLKAFGADIYLAPMIGISMIRELGPLLTAIILAGRTGSATTAEIATMGVQEELDALRTMSINPIQFVVVPKFWAISITMPLLSVIAVLCGITGGFLVAVLYLDTAPGLFIGEFLKNIYIKDVWAGFIKSIAFSWIIIWIGAHFGFKVHGGAEDVGRQTTASVVAAIFAIIVADAVFSFII